MNRRTKRRLLQQEASRKRARRMWYHNCRDSGPTMTEEGQPCNWCDAEDEHLKELIKQQTDPSHNQW